MRYRDDDDLCVRLHVHSVERESAKDDPAGITVIRAAVIRERADSSYGALDLSYELRAEAWCRSLIELNRGEELLASGWKKGNLGH